MNRDPTKDPLGFSSGSSFMDEDPEVKDPEVKDPEVKDPEVKDPEVKDPDEGPAP